MPRSSEAKRTWSALRDFSRPCILEILLEASGAEIESDRMRNEVRRRFESYHYEQWVDGISEKRKFHWHPELDDPINGTYTYGHNAIAWARKGLSDEDLIARETDVPGGRYRLLTNLDRANLEIERAVVLIEDSGHQGAVGTARVGGDILFSNAVYVIFDPARSGWCKIGAGRDGCDERLKNAQLWTRGEAELIEAFPVGSGNGRDTERKLHEHFMLEHKRKGEWFECDSHAAALKIRSYLNGRGRQ